MVSRSLGHRAPLLWLVIPFMAGLALGQARENLPIGACLAGAVSASIVCAVASWRGLRRTWEIALVAAMILAGAASYVENRPRLSVWDALPPREVGVSLRVDRVFAQSDPRKAVGVGVIVRAAPPVQELAGQCVYFSLSTPRGKPPPLISAVIAVTGVLAPLPRDPPISTFDGFLAGAGVNFRLTRGRILAEEKRASAYRRFCARALDKFSALLGLGVLEKRPELVGVLRAMLLGQQHELTPRETTQYRESGTMHVFSISGLHIAVISIALQAVLALLRLPRVVALVVGLLALWLYVDITGAAPSAIRAFVMVAFVQVAQAGRVPRNPLSALAAAALVVLLTRPLDIFSASFQMSYGIVAALLLLGLPLADRWLEISALFSDLPRSSWTWHHRWRDAIWRAMLSAVGIGVASSLVSAVTGAQFFQMFTPGSLFANLWVIPVSSLVILFGLVSLVSGLIGWTGACVLANHASVLVLWIVDWGIRINLKIPGMWFGASFRLEGLGGPVLVALLASLIVGYAARWNGWCRGFWPPIAVIVLAMIFGVKYA